METEAVSSNDSAKSEMKEVIKSTPTDDISSSTYTPNGHSTKLLDSDTELQHNSPTLDPNDSHLKGGEDQTTDDTEGSLTIDLTSPPPSLTPPTLETDDTTVVKSNGIDDDNVDPKHQELVAEEPDAGARLEDKEATTTSDGESKELERMETDDDPPSGIDQNLPKNIETDSRTVSSAPPALVDTQALVEEEQEHPQMENEPSDNSSSQPPPVQDRPSCDDAKSTDGQYEPVVDITSKQSDDLQDHCEDSPKLIIDTGTSDPPREREPPSIIKTNESLVEKTQEISEHKPTPRLQSSSSSDEMEIQLDLQDNELSDDSAVEEEEEELKDTRHISTCISNTDHQKTSNLHTIQSTSSTSSAYTTTRGQQTSVTTNTSSLKQTQNPHSNTPPSKLPTHALTTVTTIMDTPNNEHTRSHSPALLALTLQKGDSPQSSGHQGGADNGSRVQKNVSPSHRIRQVAKVKNFFSTLQQFGNEMGSEAAEQVQELISAVVNETATIEEFHQEVQTVTNHPLKDFIIPFLRDSLGYLRAELKESSHALSDILGDNTPIPNTIGLTPQLADDDLPVLPSSSKASAPLRVVSSSVISHAQSSSSSSKTSNSSAKQATHGASSSLHANHRQTISPSHGHTSHSLLAAGNQMDLDGGFDGGPLMYANGSQSRKRPRGALVERPTLSSEKEIQTISSDKSHSSYLSKRPRHDDSDTTIITSNPRERHLTTLPPAYPQPPPTHPLTTTPTSAAQPLGDVGGYATPLSSSGGSMKLKALNDDWGHVQMMLNSIQGMVDRTRQAMAVLKERINVTHLEMERQELDVESVVQQRVKQALDKERKQATEEKNRLLLDASKQLRDAVATVKGEMEIRITQAQSFAVQEALKESNVQTNSKENCWNCGRRATETCSGCNKARYCGTFCQHKDWANHMHHCASGLHAQGSTTEDHYSERQHHPQTITADQAAMSQPVRAVKLPQGITPVPVNVVGGNELGLRMVPARIPHSHTDIAVTIKTEKT